MNFMHRLNGVFDFISKLFFFLIIVFVFFAALVRWIGYPVAWSIDIAQILFGWVVFLGADSTLRRNGHIGMGLFVEKLNLKNQRYIMIFNYILIEVFLGVMVVYGTYLCYINTERLFNAIQISYSYATASVPFGCALMFITVARKLISLIKGEELNKEVL